MRRASLGACVFGVAGLVFAAAAPARADQTDERLDLFFTELKDAEAREASRITTRIGEVWAEAESPTVQLLFDRASEAEFAQELELAETLLGHVTGLSHEFAEGWAARGRVRLALGDLEGALSDFEEVLVLEPRHYPTQLLIAQIRLASTDERGALRAYLEALSWNPHLEDAQAAARRLQLRVQGQDI